MRIARSFERRLERLLEGGTSRVFSGAIHPSEMAGRIAREADLAVFDQTSGPTTGNQFTLTVSERDLQADPDDLVASLEDLLAEHAAEKGLRLEGPPWVKIEADSGVAAGQFKCDSAVVPGPLTPWAKLTSDGGTVEVSHNRAIVGRAPTSDVLIPFDEVSRTHALIWREAGDFMVRDLNSSNGTMAAGMLLDERPSGIVSGDILAFGGHEFRFLELRQNA